MGEARRRKLAGNMPTTPKPQKNKQKRIGITGMNDLSSVMAMVAVLQMRSRRGGLFK